MMDWHALDELIQHGTRLANGLLPVIESLRPWLHRYGLWAVGLGLFSETFLFTGVVIPGFAILVTAGYLVADGAFPLLPTLLAAWLGTVCGDQGSYWLGYLWGHRLLRGKRELVEHLLMLLQREGAWLLLSYHYVPWFRTIFPCAIGSTHFNTARWMLFDSAGVLLWVIVALGLGYTIHEAWSSSNRFEQIINIVSFLLIILITWRIYHSLAPHKPKGRIGEQPAG
ncbi:MAG TPA: DedA family protein [Armatimonadota bacterium]|jgi:membrane protein DedA with SNARE-associated domain